MRSFTIVAAVLAGAITASASAISPNPNSLVARKEGECGTGNCRTRVDGMSTVNNKATTACCNKQIKGLLGLGLLFTNDNLRIVDNGVDDEELDCLTKTSEGKQINKPKFNSCCERYNEGSFCV